MKAIITREKRNTVDTAINWMMGIKTEVRKPTPEEIETKTSKKSPYNLFDYTAAVASSTAMVVTTVIHPDVAFANATFYLTRRRMKKKLDKFNHPAIYENGDTDEQVVEEDSVEEDIDVVEGEVIDTDPVSSPA